MKKILFYSSIAGQSGLNLRLGCFDYLHAGHECEIQFIDYADDLTPKSARELARMGFTGLLIGSPRRTPTTDVLLALPIPKVLMLVDCRPPSRSSKKTCIVKNNDINVGNLAARHFLERCYFKSYAFVHPKKSTEWSCNRSKGFSQTLSKSGIQVNETHLSGQQELSRFFASQLKPIGILCAADLIAINTINACQSAKIVVPNQAAVIGVDDEQNLCEATHPTLTSIRTADRCAGAIATKILFAMMSGDDTNPVETLIPPLGITERDSTRLITSSGYLIQGGIDFIRRRYQSGITARDVINHLGVSATLARVSFKKLHGKSIQDEILDTRLEAALRFLKYSKSSISEIAARCGFQSACRMSHFFSERLGRSPRSYRLATEGNDTLASHLPPNLSD